MYFAKEEASKYCPEKHPLENIFVSAQAKTWGNKGEQGEPLVRLGVPKEQLSQMSTTLSAFCLNGRDHVVEGKNLGDSGMALIRGLDQMLRGVEYDTKFEIKEEADMQEHFFNAPYQYPSSGIPLSNAAPFKWQVQENDIIVTGSDGLWDNVPKSDILQIVQQSSLSWAKLNSSAFTDDVLADMIAKSLLDYAYKQSKTTDIPDANQYKQMQREFINSAMQKGGCCGVLSKSAWKIPFGNDLVEACAMPARKCAKDPKKICESDQRRIQNSQKCPLKGFPPREMVQAWQGKQDDITVVVSIVQKLARRRHSWPPGKSSPSSQSQPFKISNTVGY